MYKEGHSRPGRLIQVDCQHQTLEGSSARGHLDTALDLMFNFIIITRRKRLLAGVFGIPHK